MATPSVASDHDCQRALVQFSSICNRVTATSGQHSNNIVIDKQRRCATVSVTDPAEPLGTCARRPRSHTSGSQRRHRGSATDTCDVRRALLDVHTRVRRCIASLYLSAFAHVNCIGERDSTARVGAALVAWHTCCKSQGQAAALCQTPWYYETSAYWSSLQHHAVLRPTSRPATSLAATPIVRNNLSNISSHPNHRLRMFAAHAEPCTSGHGSTAITLATPTTWITGGHTDQHPVSTHACMCAHMSTPAVTKHQPMPSAHWPCCAPAQHSMRLMPAQHERVQRTQHLGHIHGGASSTQPRQLDPGTPWPPE